MSTKLSADDILPLHCTPPRKFETERLRLRAVEPGDSKLVFDLYASDPVATKYMSFKCTGRLEDSAAFIEPAARFFLGEQSPVKSWFWVIHLKSTDEAIGSCGFGPQTKFSLGGGYILNKNWWGKGYASEAWTCIVDWAKLQPGVFRIEANHAVENPGSGKVLLKSGMKFEGVFKRHTIFPNVSDTPSDSVIYAWSRE